MSLPVAPGWYWVKVWSDYPPEAPRYLTKTIVRVKDDSKDGVMWFYWQYPRAVHSTAVEEWGPQVKEWF